MKIHFQDFFIIKKINERKRYFKTMLDIIGTIRYFVITKTERHIYFNIENEMNCTREYKGGIIIKD